MKAVSMNDFNSFKKVNTKANKLNDTNLAVAYTRVSGKKQEYNMSIPNQIQEMKRYAQHKDIEILEFFGKKHESAKTDEREELVRMIEFIKKYNKKASRKISFVLVHATDRFSRTGGGGINLAHELREVHGVRLVAVTQPTDTSNPLGVFHQDMMLLISNYDNEMRKMRAVAGMKYKFEKGEWVVRVPQGYSIIKNDRDRKIVVNEQGKIIRKAFQWKIDGLKNDEIVTRLQGLGVKMYKQQLSKIFANPFYCGILAHAMLDGKLVEGTHEKMITPEMFLKIHRLNVESPKYGVSHEKENEHIPLKVFTRCSDCNQPFAGYTVKKKNAYYYYYKCRTVGCRCNLSATFLDNLFVKKLRDFIIKPKFLKPLLFEMVNAFKRLNKENITLTMNLKSQLTRLQEKIDNIEEEYYAERTMIKEAFDKLYSKYTKERNQIEQKLYDLENGISNFEIALKEVFSFASKLSEIWDSAKVKVKERIQKVLFPEGILYDRKTQSFRTDKVNTVFLLSMALVKGLEDNKKETDPFLLGQSLCAEREKLGSNS